jgi:flagellar motor component MotA
MLRVAGLAVICTGLMVGIGSNLPAFIDPPAALIVTICTIGMLLLGGHSISAMLKSAFSGDATPGELREGAKAWQMARWYVLAAGFMGTLVGGLIMLKNLDDPAAIGPGISIGMLTLVYGVFLGLFIFLPVQSRIESRIAESGS